MKVEGYFLLFLTETICCDSSSEPSHVVTPHLNCLIETVQMRGHYICHYVELTKVVPLI